MQTRYAIAGSMLALCSAGTAQAFYVKHNVACDRVTTESFSEWRSVEQLVTKRPDWRKEGLGDDPIVKSSVYFDVDLPNNLILDMTYEVVLEWQRINPARKKVTGEATFYGSDEPPMELQVEHQDFYHVKEVSVTGLTCHKIMDEDEEEPSDDFEAREREEKLLPPYTNTKNPPLPSEEEPVEVEKPHQKR